MKIFRTVSNVPPQSNTQKEATKYQHSSRNQTHQNMHRPNPIPLGIPHLPPARSARQLILLVLIPQQIQICQTPHNGTNDCDESDEISKYK